MPRLAIALLLIICALPTVASCNKQQAQPPQCDDTPCCELYKDEVFERCTRDNDEVDVCGKTAKHAYEACMDQRR